MFFNINNTLMLIAKATEKEQENQYLHGLGIAYITYRLAKQMQKSDLFCKRGVICGLLLKYNDLRKGDYLFYEDKISEEISNIGEAILYREFFDPINFYKISYNDVEMLKLKKEDSLLSSILRISYELELHLRDNNTNGLLCHIETYTGDANLLKSFLTNVNVREYYPGVVTGLIKLLRLDDFWFYFRRDYIEGLVRSLNLERSFPGMGGMQNIVLASLIATMVDNKSTHTYQHSLKVGELARFIGEKLHLDSKMCFKLYLAGILHDVGKICAPDRILNKCGKLTRDEYRTIQRHVTDTRGILQYILIDQDIINWASDHHERLDGTGYPLQKKGEQLCLPSRIMAVCDIFQALCQNRTYRKSLPLCDVLGVLQDECRNGKICNNILRIIFRYSEECFRIAT